MFVAQKCSVFLFPPGAKVIEMLISYFILSGASIPVPRRVLTLETFNNHVR